MQKSKREKPLIKLWDLRNKNFFAMVESQESDEIV